MPPTATYQEVARHFHSASPTGLALGMWLAPARECLKPLFSHSDSQGTTHNCSLLNFTTRWKRTFTPSSCAQVKRFDAKCWLSVIHLLRGIDNGHKINADKERLRTLHVDDLSPERFCMIRLEAFICCPEQGKDGQKHLVSSRANRRASPCHHRTHLSGYSRCWRQPSMGQCSWLTCPKKKASSLVTSTN